MSQMFVSFLQMQRHRIMKAGFDASFAQLLFQRIAVGNLHHIEVIDMGDAGQDRGRDQIGPLQQLVVYLRGGTTVVVAVVQMGQLDRKKSTLQSLHAQIEAGERMFVFLYRAMIAEHLQMPGKFRIVAHDRAAFAEGAKILPG